MSIAEPYQPEDLIALAAELVERYNGFDSTSVTYEQAQHLMEAIRYCLRMYEQSESSLPARKMLTAREAYRLGYEAVCNQARQVGALYEQVLPHFQSYGLVCLQDTVIKGIPAFLMHYDARYCPQDTLLTLDYPVLTDFSHLCGVQAVWAYLRCIALEQRFLSRLDFEFVCDSLRDYHVDYTVLIENICGIVLPGLLGHVLLEKPLCRPCFTEQDYGTLTSRYGAMEQRQLAALVRSAISHLAGQDAEVEHYLLQAADDWTMRLAIAMDTGTLWRVCLPHC